ncbi:MAG: hypothetical protein WCO60_15795 [Verrucomicrobiota bacterium]
METKSLDQITIKQLRKPIVHDGDGVAEETRMLLSQKVEEYMTRIGYTNAHISAIMVQLLTVGKIRLEFSQYHERLQLLSAADLMPRAQAVILVETYLASFYNQTEANPDFGMTQRIILQPPKK